MGDIKVFLFYYFFETTLMIYVGLALFDSRLSTNRLAICGFVLAICIWLLRGAYTLLGIPFGTHSLIIVIFFILTLRTLGNQSWGISIGASLASMTLVLISDGCCQPLLQPLGLTAQKILADPWLHILIGYTETIFLFLVLFLNKVFGITLVNILDVD